jgi:tetratricopeptide (TPR) repeat protein
MAALDRMDAVIEDVRAALDWTLVPSGGDTGDRFETGLALLKPMDVYWYRFGYIQEGRGWHHRALAVIDSGERVDSAGIVDALHGHGVLAIQEGDIDTAAQALERALEMARRLGDVTRESRESNSLGVALRERGDVEAARGLIQGSLDLAQGLADPRRRATALSNLVLVHLDAGEYAAAVDAARLAIASDEALEDPWGVAVDRSNLVMALLCTDGPAVAFRELVDLAPGSITLGDVELSIGVIDSFAAIWAAFGAAARAAAMLGAADRHREQVGIPRKAPDRALLDRFIDPVRRAADAAAWQDAYAHGRGLSIESAVSEGSAADQDLQPALQTS